MAASTILVDVVFPRLTLARNALLVVAGSVLVALCAQVSLSLPFTPVPVTGQTFAVLLIGATFGARRGAAALLVYLAEGAAGLPVFSPGGAPGFARLLGPTAGYLFAFPAAAFLVGWLLERLPQPPALWNWARWFVAALAAETLILASGTAWLKVVLDVSWGTALSQGALPFLPGEVFKALLVTAVLPASLWAARRRSAGA